jgi:hypothetical protein|uniref:Uncharacterized protein n=1 Tax=viral metagenome TaxID=1070528 RepID=A0A6C0B2M4_9ZZZZ
MGSLFRVAWRSLLTGFETGGMFLFTEVEAIEITEKLNTKYSGIIHHWVVQE